MGLIRTDIDTVRAFGLSNGIWRDGEFVRAPWVVLVKWRSGWSNMFHQVYVNRKYSGVTVDYQQREMIVPIPTSLESPVRIEVFAIQPEEGNIDFSHQLEAVPACSGRVRIKLLRSQALPVGATAKLYFDKGTVAVDYDTPLTNSAIIIWPSWLDKAGFGMSRFGVVDFGYDSAASVGFGKGSFGNGQFGLDSDTIEWISPQLSAGRYRFAAKIVDAAGNTSNSTETELITVTPPARPAASLSISYLDKETRQPTLNIS